MDFLLSDDQKMIAETARKVGDQFGLDYWRNLDAKKSFPAEFWSAVCEAGLCGVALPEKYGGAGLGMLEMALIIETLAGCGGGSTVGSAVHGQSDLRRGSHCAFRLRGYEVRAAAQAGGRED